VNDNPENNPDALTDELLLERLGQETKAALGRIYSLHPATSIDTVTLPNGTQLSLKREDISTVHSYKWLLRPGRN